MCLAVESGSSSEGLARLVRRPQWPGHSLDSSAALRVAVPSHHSLAALLFVGHAPAMHRDVLIEVPPIPLARCLDDLANRTAEGIRVDGRQKSGSTAPMRPVDRLRVR